MWKGIRFKYELSLFLSMHITIIGSGSYFPETDRHCSSYLVQIGKENLVFDFGRGVLDGLIKSGVQYYDIDTIFITHTHADHCVELGALLHICLMELPGFEFRKKDLTIYGPKGIKHTIDLIMETYGLKKAKSKHKIIVKELEEGDVVHGDVWKVQGFKAVHSKKVECLAFRLEADDRVMAYSGDTGDCPGLRMACQNADLAIIEAFLSNELKEQIDASGFETTGHLTAEQTGKIAQECRVKRLVLTHISSFALEKYNYEAQAKKFFKGEKLIAKDMMKISV